MPYFRKSKREKRRKEMRQFAFSIGGEYHEKDEFHQIKLLKDFALFRQGHSRKIINFIELTNVDREINIFDYRYVIQAGNSPVPVMQSVFFVKSNRLELPQFRMRPEHFFQKIGIYLGMQDIDFEEYPKFSKQYLLKGENEDLIRSTFSNPLLQFFSVEKGWYLEGLNYYMIFYKKGKILNMSEIKDIYNRGLQIYDLFRV